MRHALRIAAVAVAIALAGCSQIGAAEPGAPAGPGYGPGYGMMGPGYGYGQGMMMGPGYGYGQGMMMGPGMMGGWGGLPPNLTADQRSRIAEVQREQRGRQWTLMQQMHELMWADGQDSGSLDEQTQRRNYDRMAALQKQMFENMLEARKRIDAVLTPQQREELRRGRGRPR